MLKFIVIHSNTKSKAQTFLEPRMQREGTYTTGPSGRFSDSSNHTGKLASSEPRAQTDMEKEDLIQSNQHLQPSYLGLGIVLGMGVPQHSPAL